MKIDAGHCLVVLGTVLIGVRVEKQRGLATEFTVGSITSRGLVPADGKAVDAEEGGDAVDDQNSPVRVHHEGEEEV